MIGGLSIDVEVTRDNASPFVQRYVEGVKDRSRLNAAIGEAERELVRNYLIDVTGQRHETAERLGATPTGHWARAAELTSFVSDGESATVTIHDPAAGRAAHDVTITPGEGKLWLTIALIAAAYNQVARRVEGLFRPFAKVTGYRATKEGEGFAHTGSGEGAERMRVLAKKGTDGKLEFWYALVKGVHQVQDRTLLPSDEIIGKVAIRAVKDWMTFTFGEVLG